MGGFGAMVLHDFACAGLLDRGLRIRAMALPDRFLDQDAPARQYDEAGLNAAQIVQTALSALGIAKPGAAALGAKP